MATRIELPDSQWVEILDPLAVPEGKRRPAAKKYMKIGKNPYTQALGRIQKELNNATPENREAVEAKAKADQDALIQPDEYLDLLEELNDEVAIARISTWSFAEPVSVESLLKLPSETYQRIREVTAQGSIALLPNFVSQGKDSPQSPSTN